MKTKKKDSPQREIEIFDDPDSLARHAAETLVGIGREAIGKNGRFTVSLAGGSTPAPVYELLVTDEFRAELDPERTFLFIGDERDVSPISEKSNYRMIREKLFEPLRFPAENVFRWHTEIIDPAETADNYERTIRRFFELGKGEFPVFDLVLLGMGDDGHTASLFPFTEALEAEDRIAVANYVEKLDANRLTLTYPVINNAANVLFLVKGEGKSATLREVLEGPRNCHRYPAQCVDPRNGRLRWFVDRTAAAELRTGT